MTSATITVMGPTIPLPGGEQQDAWTAVRLEQGQVIAYSWSCFEARLDLETGKEIDRQFTK